VHDPGFSAVQCGFHACFANDRLRMTIVCRFQVLDRDEGDPAACRSFYRRAEDASLAHGVIVAAAWDE
jgi:hypothetical protein